MQRIQLPSFQSSIFTAIAAGSLLLGVNACVDEADELAFDEVDTSDPEPELRAGMPSNRNLRALNLPIQDALDSLSCGSGPDMDSVHDYDSTFHIQSFVYTGPFSDGTARAFSTRSDGDGSWEGKELFRNKFTSSQVRSDGAMNTGSDIGFQDGTDVGGEDHAAQIDWLPDFDSIHGYEAGYLFLAAENSGDVRIYYYHMDNGGDPVEVTTSSTRLSRQDGGNISQVYITLKYGVYWLVIGESSNFEVWKAPWQAVFPSGPGSLNPEAFQYHGEYSPSSGGGANCYFVEDANNDLYRLCYKNGDDWNCGGGNDNNIYATKVTITQNLSFSIADSVAASVNLGSWGPSSCTGCNGMEHPSFRASGSHYVDGDGDLNVYSLAFGGQNSNSTCLGSGSSDGSVKACEP